MTAPGVRRTRSTVFRYIEDLQGSAPWGSFLDAGTGTHSMGWISGLETARWTAVSGSEAHAIQVRDAVEARRREADRIVVGDWADARLLAGESYDTVLADYLLGAIEGFAPYFQEKLFARLRSLTGKRIYVVGVEPYVVARPIDHAGQIVWEIGRFRDAVLLLTGEQPYREFPLRWTADALVQSGYRVIAARQFPICYKERFVNSQIDMALLRLKRMGNSDMASTLTRHGEALRNRALTLIEAEGGIRHGFDYVIAAEPAGFASISKYSAAGAAAPV